MFKRLYILIFLCFTACKTQEPRLYQTEVSSVKLNKDVPEDETVKALIYPYKSKLDKEMNQVLIISENEAVKGQPEGKLGNLVSDYTLEATNTYLQSKNLGKADIVMLNNGGLRTSLPKGEINMGKIYELMPFENEIVVLTLSGNQTLELLKYIARAKGVPVAGLKMGISEEEPVDILIQGVAFDPNRNYKIVTSDYLANGGDKMSFFNSPIDKLNTGLKLRDVLAETMINKNSKGETLKPKLDGRIYLVQ